MILNDKQVANLKQQLRDYLGEAICAALRDPTIMEIKVGEDGILWVEEQGKKDWASSGTVVPEAQRRLALNLIARLLGKYVNAKNSRLSGDEPLYGHRFQGFVPPSGKYTLHFRCHAGEVFTFDDYIAKGIMQPWQVELLIAHIHKRSNIIFGGSTGSGKTTLLNTAIGVLEASPEHGVILEDTPEIQCEMPNFTRLLTSDKVSMADFIKDTLRVKPSRLIVGETRDEAWIAVLEAFSTGHGGGMTTLHTENAAGVFTRGAVLGRRAGIPPAETWDLMRQTIGLIVHIEKIGNQRRVTEIKEVRKEGNIAEHEDWLSTLGPTGIRSAANGFQYGTTLNS